MVVDFFAPSVAPVLRRLSRCEIVPVAASRRGGGFGGFVAGSRAVRPPREAHVAAAVGPYLSLLGLRFVSPLATLSDEVAAELGVRSCDGPLMVDLLAAACDAWEGAPPATPSPSPPPPASDGAPIASPIPSGDGSEREGDEGAAAHASVPQSAASPEARGPASRADVRLLLVALEVLGGHARLSDLLPRLRQLRMLPLASGAPLGKLSAHSPSWPEGDVFVHCPLLPLALHCL